MYRDGQSDGKVVVNPADRWQQIVNPRMVDIIQRFNNLKKSTYSWINYADDVVSRSASC